MNATRRLSLAVGAFVMAAFAVLAVMLFSYSAEQGFLRPRYRLVTYFADVQGLTTGAPVRLAGRDVGFVEFVTFAPLFEDKPPVRVVVQVDREIQDRIRTDSIASIGTIGLLGDRYVELTMGTEQGEVLERDSEIPSVSPLDLNVAVERGGEAIANIARLTENVNEVVESFGNSMGGEGLAEIANGVNEILLEIREGDGLLHGLLYGTYEGDAIRRIEGSLASLERLMREIETGSGPLHSLVYGDPSGQDALTQLEDATRSLTAILAKVDAGEGTLGLLVNDPTLYEDLKELVGGAQRSLVVRSLIRMSSED
jgi:phospholipid/cholesterol/gamma-HCH transport system substrate-binding protein